MGDNNDISFTVAEVLGESASGFSGNYEQQKYERQYGAYAVQRHPYIPPRRTKDFWPKHFPRDGKR